MPRNNTKIIKTSRNSHQNNHLALWFIVLLLICVFILFLTFLKKQGFKYSHSKHQVEVIKTHNEHHDKKKNKVKYDFYTILPKESVWVPSENTPSKKQIQQSYIVQVASFKNYQDADHLKALLLLAGYNANIKKINADKSSWSRVWIGPFKNASEALTIKKQLLRDQKIKGLIFKIE